MANHIDLHLHTNVSDGSDTVSELYNKVKEAGLHTFSVTDHDMLDGTLEMEQLIKESDNLTFIRGIEFSCATPVKKCHILGYDFNPVNPEFLSAYQLGIQLRLEKTQKRIDYLRNEHGIELTEEESEWLNSIKSPVKPHFGHIVLNRGLAPDLRTAIKEFVNPCKIGNDRIDASVAIDAVKHAGGVTVWAHPLGGEGERRLTKEEFYRQLDALIEAGIQGLECYYSRYSQEDISFLLDEAKKHNLLVSAGSDYHGKNKPNLHIGKLSEDDMNIEEEQISLCKLFDK